MFLTCIYCGVPNVHPERLYRYCASYDCVRRGNHYESPIHQSVTVTDETAELTRVVAGLELDLETANNKIETLTDTVNEFQARIDKGFADAYKVYDNAISVGRFDCLRSLVRQHNEFVMARRLLTHSDEYVRDIYGQMLSLLERDMKKVGIRMYGTLGEWVVLSPDTEYNHVRYLAEDRGNRIYEGEVVRVGYETETGMVIEPALVLNLTPELTNKGGN